MRAGRRHGRPPYRLVVVHGGPGAPGSLGNLAEELATSGGVLEPFQTADSVDGQVDELATVLRGETEPPVVLLAHSWGGLLALRLATRGPAPIARLVLFGLGPIDARAPGVVDAARDVRMDRDQRVRRDELQDRLHRGDADERKQAFAALGRLFQEVDSVELIDGPTPRVDVEPDRFQKVWEEAEGLRRANRLVVAPSPISVPVTVLQGAEDPHPLAPVIEALAPLAPQLRVHRLTNCGHEPWRERRARERFLALVHEEIARSLPAGPGD